MVALTVVFFGLALNGCGESDDKTKNCKHENTKENIVAATCTLDGQKTVVCTDCGDVLSVEKIPALGHELGEGTEYEATCLSPKRTVRQCSRCGEIVTESFGEPLGHDYRAISTTPATCTEPAMYNLKCSRSGCESHKNEPIPEGEEGAQAAFGHQYVHEPSGDTVATCTEAGGTYYECEKCGDHYVDVIAPRGHDLDSAVVETKDPTCTLKGYTVKHCSWCDEDYKVDFVPALGHLELEYHHKVDATCDCMGYDAYVCKREGCGYEEKKNVTANTAHTFDANGVCTKCDKQATKSFALMCADNDIFAITKTGTKYTVYAPSYKYWNKLIMPANVVEALYRQGVYSFGIKLGSNGDSETKTVAIQTEGGMYQHINVLAYELKDVYTYTFADANGVFDSAKDGIMFEVYYCIQGVTDKVIGKPRATCFAISFEYIYNFDIENSDTYLKTSMDYTYDDAQKAFTFTEVNTQGINEFSIRKGLLEYYYDAGYKTLDITLGTATGQRYGKQMVAWSNNAEVKRTDMTNAHTVTLTGIDLQSVLNYDLDLQCYCYDRYGTEWNPDYPMDRMIVKLTFVKDVSANTSGNGSVLDYGEELTFSASEPVTDLNSQVITYTINVPHHTYVFLNFNALFVNEKLAEGYTGVSFDIGPNSGYKATRLEGTGITTVEHNIGNGGVSYDVIPLTANGDYHLRFYLAATTDITVTARFVKDVRAIVRSTNADIAFTSEVSTTTVENDTITYTLADLAQSTDYRIYFYPAFINAKIAEGYDKVTITVDGAWGWKDCYLDGVTRSYANGAVTYSDVALTENTARNVQINQSISESETITVTLVFGKSA